MQTSYSGVGNEKKKHSKGEIDGAIRESPNPKRQRKKKGEPKKTREKQKSERDEGIRRNDASSLDKRKFHRIAIGLLRKPVAISCLPTYTHLKMERYYIEEIKSWTREKAARACPDLRIILSCFLLLSLLCPQRTPWPVPGNLFHLIVVRTWHMVR